MRRVDVAPPDQVSSRGKQRQHLPFQLRHRTHISLPQPWVVSRRYNVARDMCRSRDELRGLLPQRALGELLPPAPRGPARRRDAWRQSP